MQVVTAQARFLVTFYSVASALLLEKTLAGAGLSVRVVPVPRAVSSSCGYAVEAEAEAERTGLAEPEFISLLERSGVDWAGLYRLGADGGFSLALNHEG